MNSADDASKIFIFKRATLPAAPELVLYSANLYELWRHSGDDNGLNYTSPSGNSVIVKGIDNVEVLKHINIYFNGKDNRVYLEAPRKIGRLDIACINGSEVSIRSPALLVQMTLICTERTNISMGADCMVSRDVLMYASKAHGVYSVKDGTRRFKNGIEIGDHVWLGWGARILSGAQVGSGAVVGSYSVLAGKIPNNCAAAGNPCRVTTKDIFWVGAPAPEDGNYFELLKSTQREMPSFVQMTED